MQPNKLRELIALLGRIKLALQFLAVMTPAQAGKGAEGLIGEVAKVQAELEEELKEEMRH